MANPLDSAFSRVFLIENRAGPTSVPVYQGQWRAGALSWPQGDVTLMYQPDPNQYGSFKVVGKVPGEPSNPELVLQARYTLDRSEFLRLLRKGCDNDVQVHMGLCKDPRDFNGGWDKILIFEAGRQTDYSTDDLGALEPSQRAQVNEETTVTGETVYEISRLSLTKKAEAEVYREIVAMAICDAASCGACGLPSDGCNRIYAITNSTGASPGLQAQVVYSDDGGLTWAVDIINSIGLAEDPNDAACVGLNLVVVSEDSDSLHYAPLLDILNGVSTWVEVTTGFVPTTGGPLAIWSASPTFTWIVGEGGYIYFTSDPTAGVTVQDAGSATSQPLNAVHGIDEENVVAVGNTGAVVYTTNGGTTWTLASAPTGSPNLSAVWMLSATTWLVGTATGKLFYTTDSGVTWTERTFPGSGTGSVEDIQFSTASVGYMSHTTAAGAGRLLRTIDGGHSWYVLPEGTATIPTNAGLNSIVVCPDPNKVYAGGVAVAGGDGVIIAGA